LEYGFNDFVINKARELFSTKNKVSTNVETAEHLLVKHSFSNSLGLNAVTIEGLRKTELLRIPHVTDVHMDLPIHAAAYSWGRYRIQQPTPPIPPNYNPAYTGCGVDIYIVDSGIDGLHVELIPTGQPNTRATNNLFTAIPGTPCCIAQCCII
jgi:subtilisin family serine protease